MVPRIPIALGAQAIATTRRRAVVVHTTTRSVLTRTRSALRIECCTVLCTTVIAGTGTVASILVVIGLIGTRFTTTLRTTRVVLNPTATVAVTVTT